MIIDTDKVIVPNWFELNDIESLMHTTLTNEQYQSLYLWVKDLDWDDEISQEMREIYRDWKEEMEEEQRQEHKTSEKPSPETEKWEERWHKRSSLRKHAIRTDCPEVKCPHCGHMINTLENVQIVDYIVWEMDCEGTYSEKPVDYSDAREQYYQCPDCSNRVVETEEEAIAFLNKGKSEKSEKWEERWHKRSHLDKYMIRRGQRRKYE